MDIESRTVATSFIQPDHVDNLSHHVESVQLPIMIGHMDALMAEPVLFEATDDRETSTETLFARYWQFVLNRHKIVRSAKAERARGMLQVVAAYKEAHFAFYDCAPPLIAAAAQHKDAQRAQDAWKESLFSELEQHVKRLIDTYIIFTFHGAGYDHVLIAGALLPYFYTTGVKVQLEKRGTSVTSIAVGGIQFRDICKLLAPGTSLRKFGQMFNIEQEKAYFPFEYLTSVSVLNERRLPTDISFWKSRLSANTEDETLLRQQMAHAENLFNANGCTSVGDYLRLYLRLDVVITIKCVQAWRQTLRQAISVDFIEARKFTISSLSYHAGNKRLMYNLRPGNYSPNNAQIYRILREGMRGGLCSIFRTMAGADSDIHHAHLNVQDGGESRFCHYYDATALYPSSGKTYQLINI
jgi:hypothetical protein